MQPGSKNYNRSGWLIVKSSLMRYLILGLVILLHLPVYSQDDSTTVFGKPSTDLKINPSADTTLYKYRTRFPRASIVPAAFIGAGLIALNNPLYDRFDAKRDIRRNFPNFDSDLDDIMIFAPYIELAALNLLKIKCNNDWINTSLLILKAELLTNAIVFGTKHLSHQLRPDSSNYEAMPSGHTAQAFVAASIIHKEYREKSSWYGIGAYAIAGTVAAFRMMNNKHWLSDVLVGAGVGILSTHVVYATHKHKWGRRAVCLVPAIAPGTKGLAFTYTF